MALGAPSIQRSLLLFLCGYGPRTFTVSKQKHDQSVYGTGFHCRWTSQTVTGLFNVILNQSVFRGSATMTKGLRSLWNNGHVSYLFRRRIMCWRWWTYPNCRLRLKDILFSESGFTNEAGKDPGDL
ncbi:hypothetical protein B0H13DRAFT_1075121 [Mycena leptocephala]|nr:hypothetical protein B0H13DRAFT_1075121 [Mycena leptocephala]